MAQGVQRRRYAVRNDVHQTVFNTPIQIFNSSKRFSFATVCLTLLFLGFGYFMWSKTPVNKAPLWLTIGWMIGYLALFYLLIVPTNTYEYGYKELVPIITYFGKKQRLLNTRDVARAEEVAHFYGYGLSQNAKTKEKVVVTRDGWIWTNDGRCERVVEVEGNFSRFLQAYAVDDIIDDTRTFFQSLPQEINLHFLTDQSGQRVVIQLKHMRAKLNELLQLQANSNSDFSTLINLQKEKIRVLDEYVSHEFKTFRQFVLVDGESKEQVMGALDMMYASCDAGGSRMFRQIREIDNRKEAEIWLHNQNCGLETQLDYDVAR